MVRPFLSGSRGSIFAATEHQVRTCWTIARKVLPARDAPMALIALYVGGCSLESTRTRAIELLEQLAQMR
jgi:hypothetical protein